MSATLGDVTDPQVASPLSASTWRAAVSSRSRASSLRALAAARRGLDAVVHP